MLNLNPVRRWWVGRRDTRAQLNTESEHGCNLRICCRSSRLERGRDEGFTESPLTGLQLITPQETHISQSAKSIVDRKSYIYSCTNIPLMTLLRLIHRSASQISDREMIPEKLIGKTQARAQQGIHVEPDCSSSFRQPPKAGSRAVHTHSASIY